MWNLLPVHEIMAYTRQAVFDMCEVGDLKDAQGRFIRKPMQVATTSLNMFNMLNARRCRGNHEHVTLEGSAVDQPGTAKTATTAAYTRKFARQVARTMQRPQRDNVPTAAALAIREHSQVQGSVESRQEKRRRAEKSPVPEGQPLAECVEFKRRRIESKHDVPSEWEEAFKRLENQVPRVGKVNIADEAVINLCRRQFPDVDILEIIACRGTDRTLPIPIELKGNRQVLRRMTFVDRATGDLGMETSWERVGNKPNIQVQRKGPRCRLGLTLFAVPKVSIEDPHRVEAQPRVESPREPAVDTGVPPRIEESAKTDTRTRHIKMNASDMKDLSPQELSSLPRAHVNLGHPAPHKFASLLRQQGFRPAIVQAGLRLQCAICDSSREPKKPRPAALREEYEFNDVVAMDGLTWTSANGQTYHLYHMLDHGTNYQSACWTSSQDSDAAIRALTLHWIAWAGVPRQILVDPGTEFNSQEFGNFAGNHGIRIIVTSTESPWQNGRAERHGGVLCKMLDKFDAGSPILSSRDLEMAIALTLQAKNAISLKGGFAPELLVLGKQTRLPGSITSDEECTAHLMATNETPEGIRFRESVARRELARKCFIEADHDESLRRAT